jgi:DNA-binding NtrC family response regulator
MATVLVVDAATSVRETLRIVLGHEHDILVAASLPERPRSPTPDVLVLGLPPVPRDERALGALLERELPDVPLLLLHAAREVDVEALVPPHVPVEFLAKPFDAYGIRARVRQLLEMRRPATSGDRRHARRGVLEFPFLSHATAAVARRVLTADLPVVLIQGEHGTGVGAVARALHGARGARGSFAAVDGGQLGDGDLARRVAGAGDLATLFVANLDRASRGVQADLLELIEQGSIAGVSVDRVIVGARDDLGELASAGRFVAELAYVAGAVPVVLAPSATGSTTSRRWSTPSPAISRLGSASKPDLSSRSARASATVLVVRESRRARGGSSDAHPASIHRRRGRALGVPAGADLRRRWRARVRSRP